MTLPRVTERQTEVLAAFKIIQDENGGVSPSLEELAAELDVSKSTAQTFVRRLLANGSLVRRAGVRRKLADGSVVCHAGTYRTLSLATVSVSTIEAA